MDGLNEKRERGRGQSSRSPCCWEAFLEWPYWLDHIACQTQFVDLTPEIAKKMSISNAV